MRMILAAACFIGLAYHTWPAVNPDQETPLIRPAKPKGADHRCILKTTTQRFLVDPDGTTTYAGGFTIWMKCPSK